MTIEHDGYEPETPSIPPKGNHLVSPVFAEELLSKKGNQQIRMDIIVCNKDGNTLGYSEIKFEYITFPKQILSAKEYKGLRAMGKEGKLPPEKAADFNLQKTENKKVWRVLQFEKAFGLKRPYLAETLIGRIARAELAHEVDNNGYLRARVKAWISLEEFAAATKAQGFGNSESEADFNEPELESENNLDNGKFDTVPPPADMPNLPPEDVVEEDDEEW